MKTSDIPKQPQISIFNSAVKEALKSQSNFKFAACIHKGNKILVKACNIRYKTHPNGSGPHMTTHAEIRAVNIAKSKGLELDGLSIFIIGLSRSGIRPSKPCIDCMKTLNKEGLRISWALGSRNEKISEVYIGKVGKPTKKNPTRSRKEE